ncbi:hypothetical protein LTR95_012390 [Oleoguttula sp. CCFEE 5521]
MPPRTFQAEPKEEAAKIEPQRLVANGGLLPTAANLTAAKIPLNPLCNKIMGKHQEADFQVVEMKDEFTTDKITHRPSHVAAMLIQSLHVQSIWYSLVMADIG